jgi:uncharacterized protein (DUF1015 family)
VSDVRPFRGLRYDPARVDLASVIAPPYDVIAAAERHVLYDRDPHNAVRLELVRDVREESATDYAEVPRTLAAWQREGVLVRDSRPAFYALRQRFKAPDGAARERIAFFGLLRCEDYGKRIVRPHERTLAGPKQDRLKVLRAASANLSSVLLLYEDRDDAIAGLLAEALDARPQGEARDAAGHLHTLARIDADAPIAALRRHLADRALVIADGHHRYETSLAYRDEQRAAQPGAGSDAPFEFLLACFTNAYAPGSLLLPIHRLVRRGRGPAPDDATWAARLPGWSRREVPLPGPEAVPSLLARHLAPLHDAHAFAADDVSGRLRIFWRPRGDEGELGIRVLHRDVIEGVFGLDEEAVRQGAIEYPKDAVQTARDVRAGGGAVALYLNPLQPEDVFRVTEAGEVLPQKSTFFYPKLPTGLVFRTLAEEP